MDCRSDNISIGKEVLLMTQHNSGTGNDNQHANLNKLPDYRLYVDDVDTIKEACTRDYYINEPTDARIVENGIIYPFEVDTNSFPIQAIHEGVYDANGSYIDGFAIQRRHSMSSSIASAELHAIAYEDAAVVYGGYIWNHYGHMLTESLSRMWWFLENPDKRYKYVFTSWDNIIDNYEFFNMLGLRESDIVLLKKPMRFKSVIVPECAMDRRKVFKDKAVNIYNFLRDSVKPAKYEKIYLTRTKFENNFVNIIVNEEYFENYYRSLGYEIISPEQLPIKEQISIMAGATKVVCTGGTLHHQILFCQEGIDITVLIRTEVKKNKTIYFVINQMRKARCTFIDVSMNFLPSRFNFSCFLLMPTIYWKQYIGEQAATASDSVSVSIPPHLVLEYIEKWTKMITELSPNILKQKYSKFTLADIIISLNKYILGNELDEPKKKMLFDVFNADSTATTPERN